LTNLRFYVVASDSNNNTDDSKLTTEEAFSGSNSSKIKLVKRPKCLQLVRGPDIIETIETTTSMSFIVNKNVKLTYEEKRLPAASCQRSQYEETDWTNSTPIPITVQSRSRSEPRSSSPSPIECEQSSPDSELRSYTGKFFWHSRRIKERFQIFESFKYAFEYDAGNKTLKKYLEFFISCRIFGFISLEDIYKFQ